MPPKVLAKNNDRASGVLPVTAATRAAATSKGPAPRLKLEIRRLPPGLTLSEFEEILGDEWKLGNGKVDWREYKQGKVKLGLGKMPEQSRCYIHVVNESVVKELEQRFFAVTFTDKAGTYRNPDLKHLQPSLEFAMNQRIPLNTKARIDSRQGTIDQDPEFMTFLMAETEPILKATSLDAPGAEKKDAEKVQIKTTPLIEALRDKKANKAKATESKAEKKDAKGHARTDSKDAVPAKSEMKDDKNTKQKVEQASKDAVKALNKQVANKQQQAQQRPNSPLPPAAKNASPAKTKKAAQNTVQSPKQQNATPTSTQPAAKNAGSGPATAPQGPAQRPPQEPRQRGGVDGIKKMLQKDLGIKPKPANVAQNTPGSAASSTPASPVPNTRNAQQSKAPASQAPASPATTKPPPTAPKAQQQQTQPVSTAHPTKAYLKHANPSQGMTEILIQQALAQYGDIKSVTIDPRKGTAIALFKDNESLKKALEVRRVQVAQGTVEILDFKDRPAGGGGARGGFRGGRGGRGGARGVAHSVASPAPVATAAAAPKPSEGTKT